MPLLYPFPGCRWLYPDPHPDASIPPDVVQAFVGGGAISIFEVTPEACRVARDRRQTVTFDFNGKMVTVRPGDDPDAVAKKWWFDMYGETPAQSFARR